MPHIFYHSNDFSIFLYSPVRLRIVLLFVLICSDCHSHASMLIELGFTPLETADRLGHESVKTTLDTYSHLYPNKDQKLADRLNQFRQTPWQKKTLKTTCPLWYIKHKKSTHSKVDAYQKVNFLSMRGAHPVCRRGGHFFCFFLLSRKNRDFNLIHFKVIKVAILILQHHINITQ